MITASELTEALVALDNHYIEKTGKRPHIPSYLSLHSGSAWRCTLSTKPYSETDYVISSHGETAAEAIAALRAVIDALPSPEEQNLREFQSDLGRLIEKGRDLGIDVAFVNPLAETAKRLAENALTYQPEVAA
ncbi:hypothetical protein [Arenibacterium sp. LLYu02]|uniref:hypothetical protein n=1 Tax=Arenibacterium sp. LLYu02 TaxID=3404132 RepID=UPI003B216EF4